MPDVIILTFSFFLPSYPLDHVSRLSKKQNAWQHEKTAINKGCSRKFADYLKSTYHQSQIPNIDDFSTSSTKKSYKYINIIQDDMDSNVCLFHPLEGRGFICGTKVGESVRVRFGQCTPNALEQT